MPTRFNLHLWLQPGLRLRVAVVIILAICVAAAFMPVLKAGWVYDDVNLVRPSPALQNLAGLGRAVSTDLYSQAGSRLEVSPYWRPLAMASYWLDTRFGDAPAALHAGNILLHALAAALLALVVMRRHDGMAGIITAAFVAAWWALHPQNVEVVSWISCRYDLLTAIALLGLLVMPWRPGPLHAALFGLVFLAGLFSKEGFAAMAAVVVAMDVAARRPLRDAAPRWIAVACAGVIWMGLRALIGLKGFDPPSFESALVIGLNYLEAIALYFWRAFTFPPLTISHPFISNGVFGVLAGVVIFTALAAAAILWRPPVPKIAARKKTKAPRPLAVPVAIFLAGLVPMAGAVTMFSEVPERYFYLPSIGLALLLGELLAYALSQRHQMVSIGVPSMVGVLIIVGLILVEQRLPDWQSDDALWSAALRVDPQDPQANYNLALAAGRRGDWEYARRAIEIAARGNPDSARIATSHAWALLQTKDIPGAVREARRATILAPYQPDGWYYLAFALHHADDHAGELAAIDELLKIAPNFPRARQTRQIAACETEGRKDCLGGR
jgi:tetratricopeptide (TPR) repeat protein